MARATWQDAKQELEYFGASEEFTRSPLEAAVSAYLRHAPDYEGVVRSIADVLDRGTADTRKLATISRLVNGVLDA